MSTTTPNNGFRNWPVIRNWSRLEERDKKAVGISVAAYLIFSLGVILGGLGSADHVAQILLKFGLVDWQAEQWAYFIRDIECSMILMGIFSFAYINRVGWGSFFRNLAVTSLIGLVMYALLQFRRLLPEGMLPDFSGPLYWVFAVLYTFVFGLIWGGTKRQALNLRRFSVAVLGEGVLFLLYAIALAALIMDLLQEAPWVNSGYYYEPYIGFFFLALTLPLVGFVFVPAVVLFAIFGVGMAMGIEGLTLERNSKCG